MEPTLDMALEQLFGKSPPTPVTPQPIAAQADTTMPPAQVIPASTQEFNEVQKLWEDAQQALDNGNWQQWGEKMDQIKELLGQSGG
jgi:uncharacterized membrane protein (UPF0182 family)